MHNIRIPNGVCIVVMLLAAAGVAQTTQPAPEAPATATTTATAPAAAATAPRVNLDDIAPAALAILKRMEAAGTKFPILTADIVYKRDMTQVGDTELRTGKVYYQALPKEETARFRIHFDTLKQGDGPNVRQVEDYAYDGGQWFTVRKERTRELIRYQVEQKINPTELGRGPFPIPFGQKVEVVVERFAPHVSDKPPPGSAPAETDYIKLVTRPAFVKDLSVVWMEMWVRKDGLPARIVWQDRNEDVSTIDFQNVQTPDKLPADTFDLPMPPAGWEYRVERFGEKQ